MQTRSLARNLAAIAMVIVTSGYAFAAPKVPYPAFIQVDEIEEMFMASLPGIRARQFAGDTLRRNVSSRIDLPIDWKGSSGASPGKVLEIFVLEGELQLADILLGSGGYAYLPSGTLGFNMTTSIGARILYFLQDVNEEAVIKTPLILDSALVAWEPTETDGVATKELRADPGSGARIWLMQIKPGAKLPWEYSSAPREGYLVTGHYQHSECVLGKSETGEYTTDGYFMRPPNAVNGGPEAMALKESIWMLREQRASIGSIVDVCGEVPAQ